MEDVEDNDIPRYPPFARGLPVKACDDVVKTQATLVTNIRMSLGLPDNEFNRLLLPAIRRYADFVHLLPASEAHHHRGAGGLFRHGLEVAFWVTQASEGVIYAMENTPKQRRDDEPRWRVASCLTGLLHDAGKPLSDVAVTDKQGKLVWDPYANSLLGWAQENNLDNYFLRWRDNRHKRHERFSLLAVDRLIPTETKKYLSQSGPLFMESILEAVSGTDIDRPVAKLMLWADQESVKRDLRENQINVDEFAYGIPVEQYVFNAMRHLVSSGQWKVNEAGAKVWHLAEGAFVAWKQLDDLYRVITKDQMPGIPRDPDTLADILLERGFAVPNRVITEDGEEIYYRYWQVIPKPNEDVGGGDTKILMLRLDATDRVFKTEPPAVVDAKIIGLNYHEPSEDQEPATNDEHTSSDNGTTEQNQPSQTPDEDEASDHAECDESTKPETHEQPESEQMEPDVAEPDRTQDALNVAALKAQDAFGGDALDVAPFGANNTPDSAPTPESAAKSEAVSAPSTQQAFDSDSTPDETPKHKPTKPESKPEQKPEPAPEPKSARDELMATLDAMDSGQSLRRIIAPVLDRKQTLGSKLVRSRNKVIVRYPEGMEKQGDPKDVLNQWMRDNVIETDPIMPGKKVKNTNGIKGVVLSSVLSKQIAAALEEQESQAEKEQQPQIDRADGTKPKAKSSRKNKSKKRKNQPAQQAIRPPQATRKESGATMPPPLADMPPSPKPTDTREFQPTPQGVQPVEDENMEELTPQLIGAETVIESLKRMIRSGSGKWLASPVTKEGDFLVTSAKALDMASSEVVGLSKHALRAQLIQDEGQLPRLKIRQGRLYLGEKS